jgi:hypothetical protein
MYIMFTIHLHDERSGKPVSDVAICVVFDGWRGTTKWEWTDKNGEIHFDCKHGNGRIFAKQGFRSILIYTGSISGRVIVYC